MIRLFQWLFYGCAHVWKEDNRDKFVVTEEGQKKCVGYVSFCTCAKCGLPRRFNLT